jgi:chitin synthase
MGKKKDKQQQQQSANETPIGQTDDLISAIPQDKSTSAAVTAVLSSRFARDEIYTRVGQSIIVAVNPCKSVEICSDDHVKSIGNAVKDGKERPAHLFELAANSYFSLIKDGRNQGILFL